MHQIIINSIEQLNKLSNLQDHSMDCIILKKDVLNSLHSLNEVSAFFKHTHCLLNTNGMYQISLVDVDEMEPNEVYLLDDDLYYLKNDRIWQKNKDYLKAMIPIPHIIFQSILLLYDLEIVQVEKNKRVCLYTCKKVLH